MPIRLEFNLISHSDIPLASYGGKASHGIFFDILRQLNPSTSELLHLRSETKPFTTALITNLQKKDNRFILPARHPFTMVVTGLNRMVEDELLMIAELLTTRIGFLRLHQHEVTTVPYSIETLPLTCMSYDEILTRVPETDTVAIEFQTPCAFRRIKDHFLMPLPEMVFGSLLRKWNAYAPRELTLDGDPPGSDITVKRYHLSTRMLEYGTFRQIGFTGTIEYNLKKLNSDNRHAAGVLNLFAYFAGIGAKTTMGMGMCCPIEPLPGGGKNESGISKSGLGSSGD